ncbi:hypothetical protein AVEN_66428-1 [Araneus ventricosus]|uniref:Uncharacterized protein n=1 Tax=Araneus ventricosus TaxID=182803 RepID=A0A4Y2ELY3_ARAVE|nr:hypothetical protein AVEN_66428-1 [Araneus ventricosus]
MNSGRFPSSKKLLGKIRFSTHTPSLTPARPKIRLARTEPTKPAGAGVVVRVLKEDVFGQITYINGTKYCDVCPPPTADIDLKLGVCVPRALVALRFI